MTEENSSVSGTSCTWQPPTPKIEAKPAPVRLPVSDDRPSTVHKLASAADFRSRIKDEDCYEQPEYVTLPKCGLGVLLRKPKPLAYTLLGAPLPGLPKEDAEAESPADSQAKMSAEETAQVAGWLAKLWGNVFVHPKLSLSPGFDEIHPDWIPEEDQQFVWKFIRGEVKSSGESLSTFPASVQS